MANEPRTYTYVDVKTIKAPGGVKIQIEWGIGISIDLELIRQCGLGEASIESKGSPSACHEITLKGACGVKEQAKVLARYFEVIAR